VRLFVDASVALAACGRLRGASRAMFDAAAVHRWTLVTSEYEGASASRMASQLPPRGPVASAPGFLMLARSSADIAARSPRGYTLGMKTAVSIPDDVFEDAERLASRLRTSRSRLYARAIAEFVARHDDDRVTALMDQAVREASGEADAFLQEAARQSLQRVEW
jgi:predicted transcriptional regulator